MMFRSITHGTCALPQLLDTVIRDGLQGQPKAAARAYRARQKRRPAHAAILEADAGIEPVEADAGIEPA